MPGAAAVVVLIVRVEVVLLLPEGVTSDGLRAQVTPLIPEEQMRATALWNPFSAAMLTVEVAELPAATVEGDAVVAAIWKPGVDPDSTVNVSAAMREMLPDTPDTVNG